MKIPELLPQMCTLSAKPRVQARESLAFSSRWAALSAI
jgi:hypothetical protein